MVANVLTAHGGRKIGNKAAFRSIDTCESGYINPPMLEKYVRKYAVRGRETQGYKNRRQDLVAEVTVELMKLMDVDKDGKVTMDDFLNWSRANSVENYMEDYLSQLE